MKYPIANWSVQTAISVGTDISGAIAMATGTDDSVYVAFAAKGVDPSNPLVTLGSAVPSMNPDRLDSLINPARNTSYNLVVGKLSPQGVVQWILLSPQLITTADESTPNLVLGPSDELYVAYGTGGATFNNLNMADVPSFCANSCLGYGRQDIVLARIDQLPLPLQVGQTTPGTTPTVSWVIQSARINSCNNESVPQLTIDRTNCLVYMAWQCNQNILCLPVTGAPNVLVSCFDLNGTQYWLEGGSNLNSSAINANPVIAADPMGGVTIAYETTGTVSGGTPAGGRRIEVIRFQTNLERKTTYSRSWVLSSVSPLFPDVSSAVNTQPSILYDPTGVLCFAFLTNGTVIGTVHSATSVRDVVVAGITLQGALLWVNQGSMYIAAPFLYDNCDAPFLSADDYGNVFLSLLTVSPTVQNILLFRIHPSDGCSTWQYITPGTNTIYGVYGYALTGAPYAVFSSQPLGSFTRLAVSMRSNALYVGTTVRPSITAPGNTYVGSGRNVCVTQMSQRNYFENLSPFQYETNAIVPTPICTPTVSPAVSPAFTPASYNTILRRTKFRPGL